MTCTWPQGHLQGQADFHRLVLRGASQLDGLVLADSKARPLQQLPVNLKVGLLRAGVDDLEFSRLQQPGSVSRLAGKCMIGEPVVLWCKLHACNSQTHLLWHGGT